MTRAAEAPRGSLPLEQAWPVQRLDEEGHTAVSPPPLPENLDPPTRPITPTAAEAVQAESLLREVAPAQHSNSSIEFVRPTRPRPQSTVQRRPDPTPPTPAEPSYPVATAVGTLPSDLWRLLGDEPPVTSRSQSGEQSASQSVGRSTNPPTNQPTNQQTNQPTLHRAEEFDDTPSDSPPEAVNELAPPEEMPPAGESVTLFLADTAVEATGATASAVTLKRPGSEQEATLFGEAEGLENLLSQASAAQENTAVGLYSTSDEVEEQGGGATAVTIQREDSEGAGLAYAPEAPLETFLTQAEAATDTGGLPFYNNDSQAQSAEGSVIQLRVQREGDNQLYRLYTNADQIDSFLSTAETDNNDGLITAFASEELAAGEDVSNPVELVLWPQNGDKKHLIYMDEGELENFLAQTAGLEIGPNITVFADETEAAAGGPIASLLVKRQDDNEVWLGYVEEAQLEEFSRTAVGHFPEREIADLTRQVYQRIRHQVQIERERAR